MDDILKSCKKCFVKTIINPGTFWMTSCDKNGINKNEVKVIEYLLSKQNQRFKRPNLSQIFVGQIVAVFNKGHYCRGMVHDIFIKNSLQNYEILLIDYGVIIKTTELEIYLITDNELKNKKFGAFKVVLYGVQPITLDVSDSNNLMEGVFQKRVSNKWSTAAFKFIESQLEKNSVIFLKSIEKLNENTVSGEIYLMQKSEENPKSLGQMLCDKDFAVFCQRPLKLGSKTSLEDCDYNDIEKKIPQSALPRKIRNFNMYKEYMNKEKRYSSTLTDCDSSVTSKSTSEVSNDCDSIKYPSQNSVSIPKSKPSTQDTDSSNKTANFSSSWIIKKINKYNMRL